MEFSESGNGNEKKWFGQQTPRRWGLGNPAEETICHPNRNFKEQNQLNKQT
jgi:hypothetical protein